MLQAAFTLEGHLSYDLAARAAFTFRFADSGEREEDILAATERAEESAKAWLVERGYGYKNLRSNAEDRSQAPLGKRQRRRTTDSSAARQPPTMPSAALPRIEDRPAEHRA